jgi:hypothetical protein
MEKLDVNKLKKAARQALKALDQLAALTSYPMAESAREALRTELKKRGAGYAVRKPLTDNEIWDIGNKTARGKWNIGFARAIEQAHEIDGIDVRPALVPQILLPPNNLANSPITHADGCWSWGPAHYACACAEIAKLRGWHAQSGQDQAQ